MIYAQPGPGLRLLWVHGYTLDASLWQPIWQLLPEFDHVAIDLPGHGVEAQTAGKELFFASVDAVSLAADALKARRLVAMSYGGSVALELISRNPRRFDLAVLAAPSIIGGPVDQEAADCHLELLSMARERGLGPWLAERWLQVPPQIFAGLRERPSVFAAVAAVVRRHRFAELLVDREEDFLPGHADLSPLANAKMHLLLGEHDMPAFKRCAEQIRRLSPATSREWLPGLGHQPLLEDPCAAADSIRRVFLSAR